MTVRIDIGFNIFFGVELLFPDYLLDGWCIRIGLGVIIIRFNWGYEND